MAFAELFMKKPNGKLVRLNKTKSDVERAQYIVPHVHFD